MLLVKYNLITTKPDLQAVGDGGHILFFLLQGDGGHNKCDYKLPNCPEVK